MLEKTFGYKKDNVVYRERVGAYGIGFDNNNRIPVVMTHLFDGRIGYFLLGGGIDNDENHADCIKRECLEEAGLSVTPADLVCKGDFYHYIEQKSLDFHGIGYFYYMNINGVVAEPIEPDHSLVWFTIDEVKEKLFLPHQVWATEEIFKRYQKGI